jgi:hypothetical protein
MLKIIFHKTLGAFFRPSRQSRHLGELGRHRQGVGRQDHRLHHHLSAEQSGRRQSGRAGRGQRRTDAQARRAHRGRQQEQYDLPRQFFGAGVSACLCL